MMRSGRSALIAAMVSGGTTSLPVGSTGGCPTASRARGTSGAVATISTVLRSSLGATVEVVVVEVEVLVVDVVVVDTCARAGPVRTNSATTAAPIPPSV